MALEIRPQEAGQLLQVRVTGKLAAADYKEFAPAVEKLIAEHGKISVLLELHDFHGWEAGALWEDIKFDVKHFNDIEKLAIVGETDWEKGMAKFCRPFTTAEIRFFSLGQVDQARRWLQE